MLHSRPLLQTSPEKSFQQTADSVEHTMCGLGQLSAATRTIDTSGYMLAVFIRHQYT